MVAQVPSMQSEESEVGEGTAGTEKTLAARCTAKLSSCYWLYTYCPHGSLAELQTPGF